MGLDVLSKLDPTVFVVVDAKTSDDVARAESFGYAVLVGKKSHVILKSIIMTQYNMKQGIKKFGDDGKAAVMVELRTIATSWSPSENTI